MSEPERLFSARRAHRNDLYNNWPSHWPRIANHVIQHDVTIEQYQRFVELLDAKASERELENFFSGNREVLSLTISTFSTGHHMSWIFPKEQVRPPSGKIGGLIPDYLLAGASSGGVEWFVLELKGADKKAFSSHGNRILLSNETNSCQLLNYIDFCSRDQAYLRDGLELKGFREPRGILLIGTDDETQDEQMREFKRAWNQNISKIQIRSYSSLLTIVEQKLRDFNKK